jgi:hypothetical protein
MTATSDAATSTAAPSAMATLTLPRSVDGTPRPSRAARVCLLALAYDTFSTGTPSVASVQPGQRLIASIALWLWCVQAATAFHQLGDAKRTSGPDAGRVAASAYRRIRRRRIRLTVPEEPR